MLMEHNKETYEQFKTMLLEYRECCLVAATGGGKTYITLQLIKDLNLRALIVSPRVSVRDSWIKTSKIYDIKIDSITYTKLHYDFTKFLGYDIYIFDEAHHIESPEWSKTIKSLRSKFDDDTMIVGLTATPERYNSSRKKHFIDIASTVFNNHTVYGCNLSDAIKLGIFLPAAYVCAVFDTKGILDKYKDSDLSLELQGRLKLSIENTIKIDEILKKHTSNLSNIKGIVFVDQINSISNAYNLIRSSFPDLKISVIHSKISKKLNENTLREFENSKSGFIISVGMLNEGIHISEINTIIMLRKTFSPILYNQQIGRGFSSSAIENTIIFDFVGNNISIEKTLSGRNFASIYKSKKSFEKRKFTISDQCIIYDYISDILDVLNDIHEYEKIYRKWTEEEDRILIENYKSVGPEICSDLLINRTVNACQSRAYTLGIIDKRVLQKWTEEEDRILRENYPSMGIAVYKLLSNRSKAQCNSRANVLGLKVDFDVQWTDDEISILEKYYSSKGAIETAKMIPSRSLTAVRSMAAKLGIVREDYWTEEEDRILRENYSSMGNDIHKLIPNRTIKSIYTRANILGVKNESKYWTEEEDRILRENYPSMGKKVAKLISSRTPETCAARAVYLGIRRKHKQWTEEEDRILRENYPKIGGKVYQLLPDKTSPEVYRRARKLGLLVEN